jgi:hypothetical protein
MNKLALVVLSVVEVTVGQGALIPFGISPAGTDAVVGLSPANEVPAVSGSTGSGGLISGGLMFDTESRTLTLAVGYGSAAGFADLTGAATSVTINGPAGTNQTAGVLFNLAGLSFPAVNPAQGGILFGSVVYPTNEVANLLAGLDYIDIATVSNANGEIRGQLFPLPPTIDCPVPSTIECGSPVEVPVQVYDPSGKEMTIVWSLNGVPVQTNHVPASHSPVPTNVVFTDALPLGTNTLQVMVTDSTEYCASCDTTVTVVDTTPPVIVSANASPSTLWPPNHRMVKVTVHAQVTDKCGRTTWKIIDVESNEPVNGQGDGNTEPDWQILGDHTVDLRAERSGTGNGHIYTITIQAVDQAGNLSNPTTVTVNVPKSQGRGR